MTAFVVTQLAASAASHQTQIAARWSLVWSWLPDLPVKRFTMAIRITDGTMAINRNMPSAAS
jgi:hypothetical protein